MFVSRALFIIRHSRGTRDYKLHLPVRVCTDFQCTSHPEAKYLIEALSLRKRAVSWESDYDNLDGRFAVRETGRRETGRREREREREVCISPAA